MRHSDMLSPENTALIVIDFQEKLLSAVRYADETISNCIKLIDFFSSESFPIIMTEHYPKGLGLTIPEIRNLMDESEIVEKTIFSCFGEAVFEGKLSAEKISNILITGIETHICVAQTAFDGLASGYRVHVAADAVTSRKQIDHDVSISRMQSGGITVTTSEAALYEMVEEAGTERFKNLLKIVK